MSRLLISAAHKSSGKTTVTLGLCAAWHRKGLRVQAFKKGPDYIDPMWLGQASGRPCFNLDFYTQEHDEIRDMFLNRSEDSDIALVEGNKGLHDGVDLNGSNSTAALAKLLHTPVVLVIDTQGITRSVAPLLLGFQQFDRQVHIAGVILNKCGGSRHESKLRAVVERYTDIPVIGTIQRDAGLEIVERHLGLMPSNEAAESGNIIERIARQVSEQVDLDRLLDIARGSPPFEKPAQRPQVGPATASDIRLGIARDAAFGFYYPDDLEALRDAGAKLVEFDTLADDSLPPIDALFLGGGFPETQMAGLAANVKLRLQIKSAIEDGLPVYAECGGMMYLARSIRWNDQCFEMVGAIPADVLMHSKPVGRGYIRFEECDNAPWPKNDGNPGQAYTGHEFHYSSLENLDLQPNFAYKILRGSGITGNRDGIVYKNVLATYIHQRNVRANRWATRFIQFARNVKQQRAGLIRKQGR